MKYSLILDTSIIIGYKSIKVVIILKVCQQQDVEKWYVLGLYGL